MRAAVLVATLCLLWVAGPASATGTEIPGPPLAETGGPAWFCPLPGPASSSATHAVALGAVVVAAGWSRRRSR